MTERRWTCPQDGYYQVERGRDPVFLGTELPVGEVPDGLIRIEANDGVLRTYQENGYNLSVFGRMITNRTWTTLPDDLWVTEPLDGDPGSST